MFFETRPWHSSFLFELNLEQLKLTDNLSSKTIFKELICSPKQKPNKDVSCFKLLYERKPLKYPKLESNLLLKTSALNIIVNPHVINQLQNLLTNIACELNDVKFYTFPTGSIASNETSINNNIKLINKIKNFNKRLTSMFIDIEINAPNLIFPCVSVNRVQRRSLRKQHQDPSGSY